MAQLILYGIPLSAFVAKVRVVLDQKGAAYEEVAPPDGYGSAAYRRIVPAGSVPGLVHDGAVLSDSNAIVEYLDEVLPGPRLMPGDPLGRARVRMLLGFHDTRLEASARTLYPVVKAGWRQRRAAVAEGVAGMQGALDRLEAMLDGAPEGPNPANLALPVTVQTLTMLAEEVESLLTVPPGVAARVREASSLPSVQRSLAMHRPALEDWFVRFRGM